MKNTLLIFVYAALLVTGCSKASHSPGELEPSSLSAAQAVEALERTISLVASIQSCPDNELLKRLDVGRASFAEKEYFARSLGFPNFAAFDQEASRLLKKMQMVQRCYPAYLESSMMRQWTNAAFAEKGKPYYQTVYPVRNPYETPFAERSKSAEVIARRVCCPCTDAYNADIDGIIANEISRAIGCIGSIATPVLGPYISAACLLGVALQGILEKERALVDWSNCLQKS